VKRVKRTRFQAIDVRHARRRVTSADGSATSLHVVSEGGAEGCSVSVCSTQTYRVTAREEYLPLVTAAQARSVFTPGATG
jgi:hypothetical protein